MLALHTEYAGTLIIRSNGAGGWHGTGDADIALGYSLESDTNSAAEGVWARWKWDGTRLVLSNDRFGFLPVFYAFLPNGFGVSTSALSLVQAGASAAFDDAAIAVFLRLGHYVGEDTPFKAIRTLAPGTELSWQNGELNFRTTAPALPSSTSNLSRQDAVHAYGEVFQQAVEDMLPPSDVEMAAPLSAGRDSRHILYALVRAGRTPKSVLTARSMPPRPDNDAQMAAKITSALDLQHVIVEQSDDRFADELEKNLLTDFCADEHAHMMPVARWLSASNTQVSWDGIAGDIISCGVYDDTRMITQFHNQDFTGLCSWLLDGEGYLPGLLTTSAMQRWSRELAIERLSTELVKYGHLANPAASYFFYNRVRRELALAPYSLLNKQTHVLAPYLNHKLFDLLIDLPYDYFQGREFHSEAIDQYYPELPKLPYISVHTGSILESRIRIWRFSTQFMRMSMACKGKPSSFRNSQLIPRLAKASSNRKYGTEAPNFFARVLVLMHLEQTAG
ncbi:asparagine synthase-related protein [Granulosicoccus sp.]|nr:asparagine synthase-related protein [Granulosicoccus sp.]MDB4223417.1 asparagine synthase-related protein [Granulosicoccus sp.]